MFGKEQPDVVSDKDVGEYIDQLRKEGMREIELEMLDSDSENGSELVGDSTEFTSGRKDGH